MKFSQRIGKTPIKTALQIDGMDADLRNGLWNAYRLAWPDLGGGGASLSDLRLDSRTKLLRTFYTVLWHNLFKLPVDGITDLIRPNEEFIRRWFFACKWYEVYDFCELVLDIPTDQTEKFRKMADAVLQRESSGYRIVDGHFVQITDPAELKATEEAVAQQARDTFVPAREHLRKAASLVFDRKNPDYPNSIKEAISAVEAAARIISGNSKATLGDALAVIEKTGRLHPALCKAYSALYGYANDANGIRHATLEEKTCDFEEAKYMFVSCCAFVNYMVGKGAKAQ